MKDPLRLWEVVGVWLSALGTLSAVVVSLWLASRGGRPRLRVLVDTRMMISGVATGTESVRPEDFPDVIYLEATNTSPLPVTIVGVAWLLKYPWFLRFLRRPGFHQNPPDITNRSSAWPARLEHSQTMQWTLPHGDLVEAIAQNLVGKGIARRIRLSRLRLSVYTSVGATFRTRLGAQLRADILKATAKSETLPRQVSQ